MYKLKDWNENEKVFPYKKVNTTSCCIDTVNGPCSSIKTSCCIDTTKE